MRQGARTQGAEGGVPVVDVDDPNVEEITFAEAEYKTMVLANSLLDRGAASGSAFFDTNQ